MDSRKLAERPDIPRSTTAWLNALVKAHETGTLKALAGVGVVMHREEGTENVALEPVSEHWAQNSMLRTLLFMEVMLVACESSFDVMIARKRARMVAEQQARHQHEDVVARSTVLGADGEPMVNGNGG